MLGTLNEESSAGSLMGSHSASDGKPNGMAMGRPYFTVDSNTFYKAVKGRQKGQHWKTYMSKSPVANAIKTHLKTSKSKSVMLHRAGSQEFIVA